MAFEFYILLCVFLCRKCIPYCIGNQYSFFCLTFTLSWHFLVSFLSYNIICATFRRRKSRRPRSRPASALRGLRIGLADRPRVEERRHQQRRDDRLRGVHRGPDQEQGRNAGGDPSLGLIINNTKVSDASPQASTPNQSKHNGHYFLITVQYMYMMFIGCKYSTMYLMPR